MIGSQKAKFICTGDWETKDSARKRSESKESDIRPSYLKVTDYNPMTFIDKPKKVGRLSNKSPFFGRGRLPTVNGAQALNPLEYKNIFDQELARRRSFFNPS